MIPEKGLASIPATLHFLSLFEAGKYESDISTWEWTSLGFLLRICNHTYTGDSHSHETIMKLFASVLCGLVFAGSAYSQTNVPEVVLGQGSDRNALTQTTFLPNGSGGVVSGSTFSGQHQGAGAYFEGYYWIAVPTVDYDGNSGNAITLFPVSGIGAPDATLPEPVNVPPMNPAENGGFLFEPWENVELVVWEDQLWVLTWEETSALVGFAPLSLTSNSDTSISGDAPFLSTHPDDSNNFILTGDRPVLGLSAEVIEGELVIFTWSGTHLDGYEFGVKRVVNGNFFLDSHYLSLGEEIQYSGIFDTHVYIPNASAALPGATPGEINVLIVAASENAGKGGNQDLLMWSSTLDGLEGTSEFPVREVPYLSKTGLFTEDPGNIFVLKLSDGAVDHSVGPSDQPAVTIGILYQVTESPHFPWFIATGPLATSFAPGSDDEVPSFTYSFDGVSPPQGPNYSFSLGIQRVQGSNGDVQDYAMFATAVELDGGGVMQGYFQAAKANELRVDNLAITDTSNLSQFSDDPDTQANITEAWRLLGVIHGPPPFAYNDDPKNNTDVMIKWGSTQSDTQASSVTSTSNKTFSEQISGKAPIVSVTFSGTESFLHASGNSEAETSKLTTVYSQTLYSVDSSGDVANQGWLVYLMPEVHNQAYKAYNFLGDDLDRVVYVTWIGGMVMEAVQYTINDPSQPSTFDGARLSLAAGIPATPASDDPNSWSVVPASSGSVDVWASGPLRYTESSSSKATFEWSSTTTGENTTTKSTTYGGGVKIQIGSKGKDEKGGVWGFGVGGSFERTDTTTYELTSTVKNTFNEGLSVNVDEIFVKSPPAAGSYRSVTVTPYLLFPPQDGDANWFPSANSGSTPFLLTWTATATPVSSEVDANFGVLLATGTNRYVSDSYGTLAFADGGIDRSMAWSASLGSWLRGANGVVTSSEYGSLSAIDSPGWVLSSIFGHVHFGIDPSLYGSWVWSESLGWMRFFHGDDGEVFLYADSLRGWLSVLPEGELYSVDYRTLNPIGGSRFSSPLFGELTVGDFNGWVFSDRFGWLWAVRDGAASWFWSNARQEWLEIRGGGLWSTREQRFL